MTDPRRPKAPLLPRNQLDPTGTDGLERRAMAEWKRRLRAVARAGIKRLEQVPVSEITVNRRYQFLLDQQQLQILFEDLDALVEDILLEGGRDAPWLYEAYAGVAYQRGTAQEYANLAHQSPVYKEGRRGLQFLIRSPAYGRRIALVRARVFEEMADLAGDAKAALGRTISDGIGRGKGVAEISKNIRKNVAMTQSRADRIARTEVTTAFRRARMDETEAAEEEYGLRTKQMHLSALSASTRRSHAARHALLYTVEQQREWWAVDANSINCKCSTVTVLVDAKGSPLVPGIVERARRNYEVMKRRMEAEWAQES